MIDSDFCKICWRPYASEGIDYCDSCIKDILWKAHKKLKIYLSKISPNNQLHLTGKTDAGK